MGSRTLWGPKTLWGPRTLRRPRPLWGYRTLRGPRTLWAPKTRIILPMKYSVWLKYSKILYFIQNHWGVRMAFSENKHIVNLVAQVMTKWMAVNYFFVLKSVYSALPYCLLEAILKVKSTSKTIIKRLVKI